MFCKTHAYKTPIPKTLPFNIHTWKQKQVWIGNGWDKEEDKQELGNGHKFPMVTKLQQQWLSWVLLYHFETMEENLLQSCRCHLLQFLNYEKAPLKFQRCEFCLTKHSLMLMGRVVFCLFFLKQRLKKNYSRKLQDTKVNWTLNNH